MRLSSPPLTRTVLAAVLATLLTGCDLPALPGTASPGPVPTAFRAATPEQGTPPTPVWPDATWWHGFGSPELDRLIAAAESGNFDIAAATARIVQADASLRSAGAPLLPTVTAAPELQWTRYSYARRGTSSTLHAAGDYYETRTTSLPLSASYEIDFWGRLRANREAALQSALSSRFDRSNVALTTVSSVASTWITVLADRDRLAVARHNLADAEEILAAIRGQFSAGLASQLDVAQEEAVVAQLRAQVPALQNTLEQEINGLGILVGQPPEAITVTTETLDGLTLPEVAPGLPSELLARRPDIAQAEATLASQGASLKAARADFFPQVTLTGSTGWQAYAMNTLFGPGSLFVTAAATASQTLFDNGAKRATFDEAKGRYDELLADYRKAVVQAFTDVENALTAYRRTTEQEALQREAVARAQRAADISRAQLQAGIINIVTQLQTQTTLYTDLDTLAQVRLARATALVDLYKALGGGWTRGQIAAPETKLFQGVL